MTECIKCKDKEIERIVDKLNGLTYEQVKLLRLNLEDAISYVNDDTEEQHISGGSF